MRHRLRSTLAVLSLGLGSSLGPSCGGGGGAGDCAVGVYAPGIERGPQMALVTPTRAVVAWRTHDVVLGSVEHGPTADLGLVVADPVATTEHVLTLEGLAPGSTVHYRVALGGDPVTPTFTFRTPSTDANVRVRFAVLGDSGTGGAAQHAIAARLLDVDPDAVIHTGDAAYEHGNAEDVLCNHFVPYVDLLARAPLYLALGNHDQVVGGGDIFLSHLYLPTNPVDGSERFYSFDRGSCHVAVLDPDAPLGPGTPQGDWLAADLAASSARWKLVAMHPPVWSAGSHGSNGGLRAELAPTLEAHGVDVALCGHDHDYERSFPMVGPSPVDVASDPDYGDTAGVIYVVTGGGGADLRPVGAGPWTAASASVHHFVRLEAEGSTLTIDAIRIDGSLLDHATITK